MAPNSIINREVLRSFLEDLAEDSQETVLQILSGVNDMLSQMSHTLYVMCDILTVLRSLLHAY